MQFEAEEIPNPDSVSRCCIVHDNAAVDLDPATFFPFSRSVLKVSTIWRRYAVEIAKVHARGNDIARRRNEKYAGSDGASVKYIGAITGVVGEIRSVQTGDGAFVMEVEHTPSDFQAHATLEIQAAGIRRTQDLTHNEIRGLVHDLLKHFSEPDPV